MSRISSDLHLEKYLKQVFILEQQRDDKFLTDDDLRKVLDESHGTRGEVRQSIEGYPSHPIYSQIASMLQIWMDTKHCPILDLPNYNLLDEKVYTESRAAVIRSITPMLEGMKTLYTLWVEEEIIYRIREVLMLLGKRGLLDLLGVRKTMGTKDLWPPARDQMIDSFQQSHSPKNELSVGARALAKHCHRDHSSSWWGVSTGTERQKNEHALSVLNKILDQATWINIHWLPQELYVVEARQPDGYGARWTADGKQFRGFLEPQMVDGHETGWRH